MWGARENPEEITKISNNMYNSIIVLRVNLKHLN